MNLDFALANKEPLDKTSVKKLLVQEGLTVLAKVVCKNDKGAV